MSRVTVHPGAFVRRNYVDALGLKAADLARALEVSESTVSRFLHEKIDLSPQLAVRLGKVLGQTAESWMNMQTNFTLTRAEAELAQWEPAFRVTDEGLVSAASAPSSKKKQGASTAAA